MSMEEIEEMFEKKTDAYNKLMAEHAARKNVMKPMTLKLICRLAFPEPEYPEEVLDAQSSSSEEEVDKEAVIIEQKKQIEEAIEASREAFIVHSVKADLDHRVPLARPIIKKKMGIGLAALTKMKREQAVSVVDTETTAVET